MSVIEPTDNIYVEVDLDADVFRFGGFPFTPTPFHADLYDAHDPLNFAEADLGFPFFKYTASIASMFDQIESYITPPGYDDIAWSILMNVDTCPPEALPWLGQFVGVDLSGQVSIDVMRQMLRDRPAFQRGGIDVMASHASVWLTGTKTMFVRERDPSASPVAGGAYGITFVSLTSETPDPARVQAAIIEAKPAGLILQYYTTTGQDYQHLWDTHTSIADINSDYATYKGVLEDTPGA